MTDKTTTRRDFLVLMGAMGISELARAVSLAQEQMPGSLLKKS